MRNPRRNSSGNATNKIGLVGLWDVVAFDEVAGIHFGDKTAVQILKDYIEAGSFSRGKEELVADASLVFVGNTNTAIDVLARTNHLFQPLPEAMQDMALIDRFHFYLPEECFVGVPEEGGHALIAGDPLPPGCAYTADIGDENRAVIYRIEVSKIAGSGKLKITGNLYKATRESITTS